MLHHLLIFLFPDGIRTQRFLLSCLHDSDKLPACSCGRVWRYSPGTERQALLRTTISEGTSSSEPLVGVVQGHVCFWEAAKEENIGRIGQGGVA